MAANFGDPTQWRLQTPLNQIPYKVVSLDGEFEEIAGHVSMDVMIQASDLMRFAQEMFPPPKLINGINIPQYSQFGNTGLRINKVSFKSFDDSLPIDPFALDPIAVTGTYAPVLRCTLDYEPPRYKSADASSPSDPTTFLEVRAAVSGEFLHTTPTATTWQDLIVVNGQVVPNGKPEPNRTANVPCTVLVPQTVWTVKWNKVPYTFFYTTVRPRLDSIIGKVNSLPFPLLYTTSAKTLLFSGYDYDYCFPWNSALTDSPYINLNMKFLQKSINWKNVLFWPNGEPMREDDQVTYVSGQGNQLIASGTGPLVYGPYIVRGHCDFWKPGVGWSRLLINGREAYDAIDFNKLFLSEDDDESGE